MTLIRRVLLSIFISLACGCSSGGDSAPASSSYPVMIFADIHFNPFYDPAIVAQLVEKDVSEWESVFKSSGVKAPASGGEDTNYPLLELALAGIRQNKGGGPLILFNGDLLGHDLAGNFYSYLYGVPPTPPPNPPPKPRNLADVAAMKVFTLKTLAFVMGKVRAAAGDTPVMFALGNSDSYSGDGPTSPDSTLNSDSTFLADTADLFFTVFLNSGPDRQAFMKSYLGGGYYSAEPLPGLLVIGLNTFMFSPGLPGNNDSLVAAELAWLEEQLAAARTSGKKVWLLMHAPPGVDMSTTVKSLDSAGHLASATMMWKPEYQEPFLKILEKYPGTIVMSLSAHTHADEYRIMSPQDVLNGTPSISPCFGNNPALRIAAIARYDHKPTDYRSMNYDPASRAVQFGLYYTFSEAYGAQGYLDTSLLRLFPTLVTDSAKQSVYRGQYYSGNSSANPINNSTWPLYWCGIGKLEQTHFVDCVNSF